MPKCNIQRSCGHTESVLISGPRVEYFSNKKAARKLKCARCVEYAELEVLTALEKRLNMPPLIGHDGQPSMFLRKLRQRFMTDAGAFRARIRGLVRNGKGNVTVDKAIVALCNRVCRTDAQFWSKLPWFAYSTPFTQFEEFVRFELLHEKHLQDAFCRNCFNKRSPWKMEILDTELAAELTAALNDICPADGAKSAIRAKRKPAATN